MTIVQLIEYVINLATMQVLRGRSSIRITENRICARSRCRFPTIQLVEPHIINYNSCLGTVNLLLLVQPEWKNLWH